MNTLQEKLGQMEEQYGQSPSILRSQPTIYEQDQHDKVIQAYSEAETVERIPQKEGITIDTVFDDFEKRTKKTPYNPEEHVNNLVAFGNKWNRDSKYFTPREFEVAQKMLDREMREDDDIRDPFYRLKFASAIVNAYTYENGETAVDTTQYKALKQQVFARELEMMVKKFQDEYKTEITQEDLPEVLIK